MGFIADFKARRAAKRAQAQIESGVGELEESKLETLLEIKYSDVFNAVQTLGKGDVGKVRKLFLDFQKNLYLPHREYQRVS